VGNNLTSSMTEVLTPIWEQVLQRSPIGLEDNFFDLGGDSFLAVSLFNEIARVSGRELPPVMIYQASTIAALAAVLEQPTLQSFPALVLLKAGRDEPPVFITHGIGGNVMDFYQVVKHVQSPHAIYGMQAKGIDGVDDPVEKVEDMAQFFLDAIKKVQPHGPYHLVGYSLGGLVTMEMAQRLAETGEPVALLAMLESYPHRNYLRLRQRLRLIIRLVKHHVATMFELPPNEALSYILHPAERLVYVPRNGGGSTRNQPPGSVSYNSAMRRMRDSGYRALKLYRPRYYCGKIKFVKAAISVRFPDDPVSIWGNLAKEFVVETVPGDHTGIITNHFEILASVLSRFLQEAFNQK
jgi:thioesterase domain-containing protein/acyl carrier protein